MSRNAQAPRVRFLGGFQAKRLKAASLVLAILVLPACASGGFSLQQAEVDSSLYTGNVSDKKRRAADVERISDEATIRNAVSSADIESLGGRPVPWVNSDTGTRGIIDGLKEFKRDGLLCRRFSTTRESFDGIALFRGEACMVSAGAWRLQSFEAG